MKVDLDQNHIVLDRVGVPNIGSLHPLYHVCLLGQIQNYWQYPSVVGFIL